jgi:hypothetical protein
VGVPVSPCLSLLCSALLCSALPVSASGRGSGGGSPWPQARTPQPGEEEFFCAPDPATTRSLKPYNYKKLQPCGFVPEDTGVEPGDVIVGKCMPHKTGQTINNKDTSVALKSNERGFVDRNCYGHRHFPNVTGDGYTFAKVTFSLGGWTRAELAPTTHKQKLNQNLTFSLWGEGASGARPLRPRAKA